MLEVLWHFYSIISPLPCVIFHHSCKTGFLGHPYQSWSNCARYCLDYQPDKHFPTCRLPQKMHNDASFPEGWFSVNTCIRLQGLWHSAMDMCAHYVWVSLVLLALKLLAMTCPVMDRIGMKRKLHMTFSCRAQMINPSMQITGCVCRMLAPLMDGPSSGVWLSRDR